MNIFLLLLILLLTFGPQITWGQGTILDDSFFSPSLGTMRNVTLYLPEGYFSNPSTTYPVVYFLHGFGGNNTSYSEMYPVLDSLISNGVICPMIVVKPDGSSTPYVGSFYTNSELNGDYEDYIVYDLITYIDSNYRTLPERRYRGISGHSMGGYGTMKLAMKHSDLYSSLTCHSGPIKFDRLQDLIPSLMAERDPGEPFQPWDGSLSLMFFAMSAAFTPNLSNPPFFVDLPLDTTGTLIDSVWIRWFDHDPYTMINLFIPALESLAVYFDCGDQDELLLFPHSVEFSDTLTALGILHTFVPYSGGHSDSLITRTDDSFIFHSINFCGPIGIFERNFQVNLEELKLFQNYPNPFSSSTVIRYEITHTPFDKGGQEGDFTFIKGGKGDLPPHTSPPYQGGDKEGVYVRLIIYDITGRLVANLVNGMQKPGIYESPISNHQLLSSGVYFYRLVTPSESQVLKMSFLK